MSRYLAKSPNGLYHEFSTVVDSFTVINCKEGELSRCSVLPIDVIARQLQEIDEFGKVASPAEDFIGAVVLSIVIHGEDNEAVQYLRESGTIDDAMWEEILSRVEEARL